MRKIYIVILSSFLFNNGFATASQVEVGDPLDIRQYTTCKLPQFKGAK